MEVVNILYNGSGINEQTYSSKDLALINSNFINNSFGDTNDYIEFFITDENSNLLDYSYNSKNYYVAGEISAVSDKSTAVIVDPEKDVKSKGINRGVVNIQYNFLKNILNSSFNSTYWIKEISNSRLELKLSSQAISGESMRKGVSQFQTYTAQKNYFGDFYLNFGNNKLIIAVNAAYVNQNGENYVLIKLYEPLPVEFDLKSTLWIVDKIAESTSFKVDIQVQAEQVVVDNRLRGPNFKVEVTEKIGQTTPYYSYSTLFSSTVSSSLQQLMSYYDDKAVSINVDYTNFNNFIHFSSATERINNFVYKLGLIESYNEQILSQSLIPGNQSITSASIQIIQNSIDNIIQKFDTYEYYLYYASESFAWPKSNITKPYTLYSVTSSEAYNWLGSESTLPSVLGVSMLYSASFYDQTNKDLLKSIIPQYILDDPQNEPYTVFLDMIGQHFDNVWIYYKDVTNRYNGTNNPNTGISLDLVADALKGFGVQLYTNTNLSDNVFYSLFGFDQNGSNLPPTGSEGSPTYPISYVTSSIQTLPYDQIQKEIYKRLYHNLPYLLKTRGTERGIKALISCYGIPDTILRVNEFGGELISGSYDLEQLNNNKINIFQLNELSESVLSKDATLQIPEYSNYRKNSVSLEIGFSPADIINADITGSDPNFRIDNYISSPGYLYSSSYEALDIYKNNYFQNYAYNHNVWEYIRLIKFYNNSLFKMLKDFVPARTDLSTGIIIKPHILERNKYARNEPDTEFFNNLSESIDTADISGSYANQFNIPTTTYNLVTSSMGYIPVTNSFGFENYTGEYQGTDLLGVNIDTIGNQNDLSKTITNTYPINYGPLFQNITSSIRSQRYLDLDYSNNLNTPVNLGIITQSINKSISNNYSTYTDPNSPYAELQDYNYFTQRSTIPRYYGSKMVGKKYNEYTKVSYYDIVYSVGEFLPSFDWQSWNKSSPRSTDTFSTIQIYAPPLDDITIKFLTPLINSANKEFIVYQAGPDNIGTNNGQVFKLNFAYRLVDNNLPTDYVLLAVSEKLNGTSNPQTINTFVGINSQGNPYAKISLQQYPIEIYNGDKSYGKEPVINHNSYKIGWVKNIPSQSLNFYDKTTIYLKYLVDENSNVLDLSLRNDNLFEVQNTFKTGDIVKLSLSDTIRPSLQTTLDGNKSIFKGGYSYEPVIFRQSNEVLKFQNDNPQGETVLGAGIKGYDRNSYFYQNTGTVLWNQDQDFPDLPPQNTTSNIGYVFSTNYNGLPGVNSAQPFETLPMATALTKAQWQNKVALDAQGNTLWHYYEKDWLNIDQLGGFPNNSFDLDHWSRKIYAFNLFKFNSFVSGGYYTENFDVNTIQDPAGLYAYKVQRPATYNLKAYFTVGMAFCYENESNGENGYVDCHHTEGDCCCCGCSLCDGRYEAFNNNNYITRPFRQDDGGTRYRQGTGAHYKLVGVLEKTTTPNIDTSWEYVASTRMNPNIGDNINGTQTNGWTNTIYMPGLKRGVSHALTEHVLVDDLNYNPNNANQNFNYYKNNGIQKTFNYGDCLRLVFYLVDSSAQLEFGRYLAFEIGKPTISDSKIMTAGVYNNITSPFFEINDPLVTSVRYTSETTVSGSSIFTVSSSNGIVFSDEMTPVLVTGSKFIPDPNSNTTAYYSPVIEESLIKPFDLLRIGSITSPKPEYYTILTAGKNQTLNYKPINPSLSRLTWQGVNNIVSFIPNLSWNNLGRPGENYSTIQLITTAGSIYDHYWAGFTVGTGTAIIPSTTYGSTFITNGATVSGITSDIGTNENMAFTIPSNLSPYRTIQGSVVNIYVPVSYNLNIPGNPQTINTQIPLSNNSQVIFTPVSSSLSNRFSISVDPPFKNYSSISSQNFAILRPVPNETSVIIDFHKQLGDVSQTILIPQDASDNLKNKVGEIFQNLNVDLSNQNTQINQ